jgi:RHS repeat-associated protein
MISDNAGLALKYDHTQRPIRIARGALAQMFDYAPDGMRFRQAGSDGEVGYFGGLERRYSPAANDKTYVGSSAVVTQAGATRTVKYLLTDRLGSVDAVASASGALLETRGYDAFGKPRTGTWADALPPRLGTTTNTPHGFTGHEHLNLLELIHMNGRVYDYNLGRFMGVDAVIQFPLNSQSLNPYSYILNNPLAGTDPTGYEMMCVGPSWACRQMAIDNMKGQGAPIGFAAILGSLGLSSGGGSHDMSVSNGTRRLMSNGAHTKTRSVTVGAIEKTDSASGRSNGENANGGLTVQGQTVESNYVAKTNGSRSDTNGIVLHRTGGRSAASALNQWKSDGLGTHFIIDENGKIIQTADVNAKTSHVGRIRSRCADTGSCSAEESAAIKEIGWNPGKINAREQAKAYPSRYPTNNDSIGIEVVGSYNANADAYSPATTSQLNALNSLVGALQAKYDLRDDDVYRHSQVSYKAGNEGDGLGYDP